MKSLLTSVAIAIALFFSACSLQEPAPMPVKKSLKTFLTQKRQAEQIGLIEKLEISNIELERTTTGAKQKFASFSNTYSPALELFEISYEIGEKTDIITLGIKQGGEVLDLNLKFFDTFYYDEEKESFISESWMEINGIKYTVEDELIEETEEYERGTFTFKPTQPVPGTSNDYTNLINALNLGNGPKFNLSNLRVLNLDSVKLTLTSL